MSLERWRLLARTTFTAFAFGSLGSNERPANVFADNMLVLHFYTRAEFETYIARAFRQDPSRCVDFEVEIKNPQQVICTLILNLTPKVHILKSGAPPPPEVGDSDVVIYV